MSPFPSHSFRGILSYCHLEVELLDEQRWIALELVSSCLSRMNKLRLMVSVFHSQLAQSATQTPSEAPIALPRSMCEAPGVQCSTKRTASRLPRTARLVLPRGSIVLYQTASRCSSIPVSTTRSFSGSLSLHIVRHCLYTQRQHIVLTQHPGTLSLYSTLAHCLYTPHQHARYTQR